MKGSPYFLFYKSSCLWVLLSFNSPEVSVLVTALIFLWLFF